jgi:large repetitive protein
VTHSKTGVVPIGGSSLLRTRQSGIGEEPTLPRTKARRSRHGVLLAALLGSFLSLGSVGFAYTPKTVSVTLGCRNVQTSNPDYYALYVGLPDGVGFTSSNNAPHTSTRYVTEAVFPGDTVSVSKGTCNYAVGHQAADGSAIFESGTIVGKTAFTVSSWPLVSLGGTSGKATLPSTITITIPSDVTSLSFQEHVAGSFQDYVAGKITFWGWSRADATEVKVFGHLERFIAMNNVNFQQWEDLYILVSPVPTAPDAPAAPVVAPGPAVGELSVSWEEPADNGSAITGYTVTSTPPGASCVPDPATATSCIASGLTPGDSYTFQVVATNEIGSSDASVDSDPGIVPGTPDAAVITSSSEDDESVTFTWTAVTDGTVAAGYGTVTYEYRQSSPTAGPWTTAASNTATVTGLTNGTEYTFEVRVTNEAASGSVDSVTLTPRTTPDAPASITLTPRYRKLDVAWTAPGFDGGAAISGYEVRYRAGTSGAFTAGNGSCAGTLPTTTLSCNLTPLADGTAYQIEVFAINVAGEGDAAQESAETAAKVVVVEGASTDADAIAGESFGVQVRLQTSEVNVLVSGVSVTVALSGANAGDASLSGTLTQSTDAQGIASFSGLSIDGNADLEGTPYTLTFSVTGLTSADHTVSVLPGDPVAVSIDDVSVEQLRNIPFDVTVRLRDEFGNETTARSAVTVTLSGSGGVEVGNARLAGYPLPSVNPEADVAVSESSVTFEDVVYTGLSDAGGLDVTISAAAAGLTSGASNAVSVRAIVIEITADDDFILADGEDSTSVSFTVTRAAGGSGVANQTITFVTTGGSFGEDGQQSTAVTNASGVATITLTSDEVVGPVTITGYCPGDCNAEVIVDFAQRPDAPDVDDDAVVIEELDESASVTFTPLEESEERGYAPITHYEYSLDQGANWVRVELAENPFTIPDLENGVTYDDVWFRARNDASSVGSDVYSVLPAFTPYHYPSVGIGGGDPILVYADAGLPTALQPTVRIPITWDDNGRDVTRFEVMLRRDGDDVTPARTLFDVANLVNADGVTFDPLVDTQPYLQIPDLFWSAEFTAQVRAENLRGWGLEWVDAGAWVDPSCPTASAVCFDGVTEGSPEGVTLTTSFITRPGPVVMNRVADDVSDGDRTVTFMLAPNPNSGLLVSGYRFQSLQGPVSSPRSGVNVVPLGAASPLAPGQITLTSAEFSVPAQAFQNGVPTTVFVWAYHTIPATGEGEDVTPAFDLEGDERTLPFNPYGLASVGFQPATLAGIGTTRTVTLVVDENGRPVTNVIATAREHGTDVITWRNAIVTGSDTTRVLTLDDLRYATRYEWLLQAENLRGASLLPAWGNPTCPTEATATCPTTLTIAFTTIPDAPIVQAIYGDTTITVTLTAASDSGPVIDAYAFSLSTDDGVTWTEFTPFDPPAIHTPEPVTATIAGLTNGVTYRVRVHAINEVGAGAPGYPAGDVMPRTTPEAPTNVVVTPGDTLLTIAWDEPYDGGLPITAYEYSIDDDTWQAFDPGVSSSPGIIMGLTNGVTYPIRIRAINDEGAGDASTPRVSGTPFANLGAIGAITTFTGNAQAWLWYDPVPNAIRYELSLDGGAWMNRHQERPMHLTNLTNGQTYTARIRPIGDTGPGRASNEVTFTPTGPAPIPDAEITIDPPVDVPSVEVDREGFGELTFAFVLTNTRDEFLANVWLHPRNLPSNAEILRMIPERGTLTLLPTGQWYWEEVNLEFEGDTATILMTVRDRYDAPCGGVGRRGRC